MREQIAKIIFEKHAPMGQTWEGYSRRYWGDLSEDEQKFYLDTADEILAINKRG